MKIQLLLSLTSLLGYSYAQQENKKLSILDRQSLHEYSLAKCSDGSSAAYYIDKVIYTTFGIQIRNMKMVFNIYGTWHWETFEKLMMKIHDFFYSAKSFSHPI